MQYGELRSYRGSWLVSESFLQSTSSTSMKPSTQEIHHPTSSSSSSSSPTATVSSDSEIQAREDPSGIESHPASVSNVDPLERGHPLHQANQTSQTHKNEDHDLQRRDPLYSEIPEWLHEFRENLVDDRVPELRDSHASSSHEPSLEPTPVRSEDLGKHSVYTHFPKDRNCEICQRSKITKAPVQKTQWRSRTSCKKCW